MLETFLQPTSVSTSQIRMELQEDNAPTTALANKEDTEDQAGANNNNLPAQVSVDELELLRKLEEANR